MSEKTKDKSFEDAYVADKKMKEVREEELQAAKEYLKVLMEEMDGRNQELEETKRDAAILRTMLKQTESEINNVREENIIEKKRSGVTNFWMCFALIEAVLLVCLVVALFFYKGKENIPSEIIPTEAGELKKPEDGSIGAAEPHKSEIVTARYTESLASKLESLQAEDIAPFTASIETIGGCEYLCFAYEDIKIGYRNEYYIDEMNYRKSIIIDNGSKRMQYNGSYDLESEWSELCPILCTLDGRKVIMFCHYMNSNRSGIPDAVNVIDCTSLDDYNQFAMSDAVNSILAPEFRSEAAADGRMLLEFKFGDAAYCYGVTEAEYNEVAYSGDPVLSCDNSFTMTIGEDGIRWLTYVKMGDSMYLGELKGSLGISGDNVVLNDTRYGAFVPANQEDEKQGGIITPASELPEEYIAIGGRNSERFLIALSDKVERCSYSFENLNIEDANNWVYFDEDGQKVSVRGIDVSKYQGDIDWQKVKDAGVEFAIIRLGYRGMTEGTLELDPYFKDNIREASEAGMNIGVYFFSQAINSEEAEAEAAFVLENIAGYNLTYPVVFDTERITTYDARANGLSRADRTDMCVAFCNKIAAAGYHPMIYANTKYMIMGIDLERLTAYDLWFAYYSPNVTFPYSFDIFQYSESGSIPGIDGAVDLNIAFKKY